MKKVLEIIGVIVAVFFVIGACVFLSRMATSKAPAAPENIADEVSTTVIIGGGP
jgi:hypothetical protein